MSRSAVPGLDSVSNKRRRGSAQQLWGDVPVDLIAQIWCQADAAGCWSLRQVSEHWAAACSLPYSHELSVVASRNDIGAKISKLHWWRQVGRFSNFTFCFQVEPAIELRDLETVMQHLYQSDRLTECSVSFDIVVRLGSQPQQLMLFADSIADLSYILEKDYDLKTSISVLAPSFPYVMPPKAVLYRLKEVLHRFDIHSISTDQPASSDMAIEAPSAVSNHHASALFDDSTLTACTMWVSDTAAKEPPLLPLEDVMTFVGVLENLTKLHLTLSEDCTAPEFEALSELSWLEDLALQCLSHASDASDVIYSSSQTLCSVTLSAASWTANTYTSLQQATQLETLNVRIKQLDLTQGHALGGVVADKFQLSLHRSICSPVVKAMAARSPILHNLSLWNHTDAHLDWLPELPTLQSITFVNSLITGKTMKQYNEVTKLEFMNCHHVSGPGLRHMIDKAFPSLKALSFFAAEGACVKAIRLSVAAMRALPCGQNLQLIDLRGIFNLSQDRIDQLQRAFVKQQRQGKAQPVVKVLLPNQGVAAVQYVLKIKDTILAPNIFESRRFFCEHEVVFKP